MVPGEIEGLPKIFHGRAGSLAQANVGMPSTNKGFR
jgi:hypothetical protein